MLADKSVEEMRIAARAWRKHDAKTSRDLSVYDRIDELIDEIERLRAVEDRIDVLERRIAALERTKLLSDYEAQKVT